MVDYDGPEFGTKHFSLTMWFRNSYQHHMENKSSQEATK